MLILDLNFVEYNSMYKCKYQFSSFPFIKLFMLFHIKKTSSRLIFVAAAKNKRVQFISLPQEDHA